MSKKKQYETNIEDDCKKMVKAYKKVAEILEDEATKTKNAAFRQAVEYLVGTAIPEEIEFWDGEEGLDEYIEDEDSDD